MMKGNKIEFKFFTVPEWEKEQDYLRQQHKNGWKFVKVNFFGMYHFEKCIPEDVVYQLDYNPEGLTHKEEYIQMFRDCGWEYMQDYVGYSYFRKAAHEMNGAEEIFCDDSSRLDMMKRVFKGRIIPMIIVFFGCILPQLFVQSHLDGQLGQILMGAFIVLGVVYLYLLFWFGYQFWKCWQFLHTQR